ncbi:hypothetical protein NMY22_g19162 [Coprinellus aureogranulatus]|nr:hypothetical protein NMY22_g19162 [Coprinellus aureogranulatus]
MTTKRSRRRRDSWMSTSSDSSSTSTTSTSSSDEEYRRRIRKREERKWREKREKEEKRRTRAKETKESDVQERERRRMKEDVDESWETMKLRLDEVERIAQRLSFLKPFDSDYAGLYIRLKAIRADLVDGILPPSWPRDPGFISRHSLASSTLTVPSYAPDTSSTPIHSVATQATRPSTFTPIRRKCYFCGRGSHKIRNCRVAVWYLKQGKCIRVESTSLIMHVDGTPIAIGRCYTLKDRIDARFLLRSRCSRTQPLRRPAPQHAAAISISASIPSRVTFTTVTQVKSMPTCGESSISKEPTRPGRSFTIVAAQEPVKQVRSRRMSSGEG